MINSYKDLIVWQKAMDLVEEVYNITSSFPKTEVYGLTSQMRRSAVSIPSNIAEGRNRGSKKDYRRFIFMSRGSGAELQTQIEIAKRLNFKDVNYTKVEDLLEEVMKMLNKMGTNLS
ncbi:MAG: four helix bundle protein [Candidatus Spechtbacterales bacterium]